MAKFSDRFRERLSTASSIAILTGAGMSAESGIATFRGKDGLWNKYNPQDLANEAAFRRNPPLVWEWYTWRRGLIKKSRPNLGHYALVDMEAYFQDFAVITQNVDSFHTVAGTQNIIELHGNIMRHKCIDCSSPYGDDELARHEQAYESSVVPDCQSCGASVRPDVVWFGESLPEDAIRRAQEAAATAEILLSIGTSSTVEPAASLPYLAKGNGAFLVEINPEETPISSIVNERFSDNSATVLPLLSLQIEKLRRRVR